MTEENEYYRLLQHKKEEETNAAWSAIRPKARLCKTCLHKFPDTEYTVGAEKSICDMFLDEKPTDVLWGDEDCDFYEKEE